MCFLFLVFSSLCSMPEEFGKVKTSLSLSEAFISRRLCSHKHKPSALMFQLQILALRLYVFFLFLFCQPFLVCEEQACVT